MMRLRASFVVLLVAACGGGSSPGSLDTLPGDFAHAYCTKAFACCTMADIAIRFQGLSITDEASCEHTYSALLTLATAQTKSDISKGTVTYDSAAASACLDALAAESCPEFARSEGNLGEGSCPNPFQGKVADGMPCDNDAVCTSGYCEGDVQAPQPMNGTCKQLPTMGQPCPDFTCAAHLRCDLSTSTPSC